MNRLMRAVFVAAGVVGLILMASSGSYAQKLAKQITIQAQAMGTSTQLGRNFSLNLIIQELSTDADRQGLIEAFTQKGNEGLVNALDKMRSKGRMSITGTLGYEITYIKMWKQPDGTTRLRLVTDRPITFGEAWADSRSKDYSLSAVELILSPNKKQNKGTLYPACQLKMNKEGELELQLYQNAWNLVNIMKR